MFSSKTAVEDALFWGLILMAAISLLGTVVWLIRRWSLSDPRSSVGEEWSLQHLRDMKKKGQITRAEFESLKAKMLDSARAIERREDRATSAGNSRFQ